LGQLQSVTIKATGRGNFTQMFENLGPSPESLSIAQSLHLGIQMDGLSTPLLSLSQNSIHEYHVSGFDGLLDFAGTSGGTSVFPVDVSRQATFSSPDQLGGFIGSSIALRLSAHGSLDRFLGGANGVLEVLLTAGADISATYCYIPVPVPEPCHWTAASLLLLGVSLAADVRRRRWGRAPSGRGQDHAFPEVGGQVI
jgi:hypothetical protein